MTILCQWLFSYIRSCHCYIDEWCDKPDMTKTTCGMLKRMDLRNFESRRVGFGVWLKSVDMMNLGESG